jgi:HKD family nuclease
VTEPEKLQLVNNLTEEEGYYAAFYCTYGADLAFFEEVLLHSMRVRNVRQHVIFMDAVRYRDTTKHLRGSLTWVGRRYLVVPVHMSLFTVFHPKLVLLAGEKKGRLFVGSGNLTFSGFGHNHELYSRLDWAPNNPGHKGSFVEAWQFLRQLHEQWSQSALVREIMEKTEYVAPWLISPQPQGPAGEENSLKLLNSLQRPILEQVAEVMDTEVVKRITIITPFLDRKAEALRRLFQLFQPGSLRLVLQQNQAVGDPDALENLADNGVPLEMYGYPDQGRYLHAKLFIFETETRAFALLGSPNCTKAALIGKTDKGEGNVETAFLHRGDKPSYFDYLLRDMVQPENKTDAALLGLRADRLLPNEVDQAESDVHAADVRLYEAMLTGNQFSLRLQFRREMPPALAGLRVKFSTIPELAIDVQSPSGDPPLIGFQLSDAHLEALRREAAVAVTVDALNHEHEPIGLLCNELWVTHFDELRNAAQSVHHGAVRATDFLAEMAASSESDWRDLFVEIQRLVELDVTRVSKRSTTTAEKPGRRREEKEPLGKETQITIAGADHGTLELEEEEELASAIARESEFHAFFEYIRRGLPGSPRSSIGGGERPKRERGGSDSVRRTWAPERRMRIRFVNLIQKYIRSLHNPEYMEQVRIPDALSYYVVFQRIIWLLYTHNETLDDDEYLQLALAVNDGFFGQYLEPAPVHSPCLRRHIRRVWADDWLTKETALYALVVLDKMKQFAKQHQNPGVLERVTTSTVRILACLHVATDTDTLREQIGSLVPLESVSLTFHEMVEELAVRLLDQIDSYREEVIIMLKWWASQAVFDAKETVDAQQIRLLYQANIDYRKALFALMESVGPIDSAISVARELIFWSERAGSSLYGNVWRETLIELLFRAGQDREGVKMLYNLGNRQFAAADYVNAQRTVKEGSRIAKKIGDEQLFEKCERLAANIRSFAKRLQ